MTGGCGRGNFIPQGAPGKFCQPCTSCQKGSDSVTGKCWIARCGFERCQTDANCKSGKFCNSKKLCVAYDPEYCDKNECGLGEGDCDRDDKVGCAGALVCGKDNCGKFHKLGGSTGFGSGSDCCDSPHPTCASHSKCGKGNYCATTCFTGKCGKTGTQPAGTAGKFCQPCSTCTQPSFSINSDCSKCEAPVAAQQKQAAQDTGATDGEGAAKADSTEMRTLASGILASIMTGWALLV